jgi:hypothetical protein
MVMAHPTFRARRSSRGSRGTWNVIPLASIGGWWPKPAVAYNARRPTEDPRVTTDAGRPPGGRTHALAPAHLGDARAAAALAITVLGIAVFIAAVGVVITGLTLSGSFDPGNPPPNAAELGTAQVLAGFGLFVVGVLLAGGGLALLAGSLRARVPTAILALLTAAGAIAGGVAIILRGPSDLVLALSLFGLALGLIIAALLLLRPRA